jgi:hypothetical protein
VRSEKSVFPSMKHAQVLGGGADRPSRSATARAPARDHDLLPAVCLDGTKPMQWA